MASDLNLERWDVSARFDQTRAYGWIHEGRVVVHVLTALSVKNERLITTYINPSRSINAVLTGSTESVAEIISIEVSRGGRDKFVSSYLPYFLVSTLPAIKTEILDSGYERNYEQSLETESKRTPAAAENRSLELIKRYARDPVTRVDGTGNWEVAINVVTATGTVEEWRFRGMVTEFSIDQWERRTLSVGQVRPLRSV